MKRTLIVFPVLIIILVIAFFAYDLLKRKISPCDTIFEQTSAQLGTKLTLVKAVGEVNIGNEKIQELTETAQLTALNLKTCCIVLSAGEVDSGQFLECKNSAAQYEVQLDTVISQLEELETAKQQGNSTIVEQKLNKINASVEEAKSISQALKNKVELIPDQKDTGLQNRKSVKTQEVEPNGDTFNATSISLNTKITGQVSETSDNDYFRFTTPPVYRDIISISLENRSTILRPALRILNDEKSDISGWKEKDTPGADLKYSFSSPPDASYYIQIKNYNNNSSGTYVLTVNSQRAYDKYEPNDNILDSKTILLGKAIDAAIMDRRDNDFYQFEAPFYPSKVTVFVKNRSTSLRPALRILDDEKSDISGWKEKNTPGADLKYSFSSLPNAIYYIQIKNYNNSTSGAYTLTVETKKTE